MCGVTAQSHVSAGEPLAPNSNPQPPGSLLTTNVSAPRREMASSFLPGEVEMMVTCSRVVAQAPPVGWRRREEGSTRARSGGGAHLTAKRLEELDGHVAQAAQAHHAHLHARLVLGGRGRRE